MTARNLCNISNSLLELKSILTTQTSDFIDIEEAANYLRLKKSYLYNLVYLNKIPFYKPSGKKLYFKKLELNQWIENSRSQTLEELTKQYEKNRKSLPSLDK